MFQSRVLFQFVTHVTAYALPHPRERWEFFDPISKLSVSRGAVPFVFEGAKAREYFADVGFARGWVRDPEQPERDRVRVVAQASPEAHSADRSFDRPYEVRGSVSTLSVNADMV